MNSQNRVFGFTPIYQAAVERIVDAAIDLADEFKQNGYYRGSEFFDKISDSFEIMRKYRSDELLEPPYKFRKCDYHFLRSAQGAVLLFKLGLDGIWHDFDHQHSMSKRAGRDGGWEWVSAVTVPKSPAKNE